MRRNYTPAPYALTLRAPATCAETGAILPKGTEAVRYGTRYYGPNTKQAEEYRTQQFSRAWGMADSAY